MTDREKSRVSSRKKYDAKRRKKFLDFTSQLKLKTGCEICGYKKHSCALHFDHRDPKNKLFSISNGHRYSWKKILAEIKKCRILCANCHAVQTKEKGHHVKDE